MLVEFLMKLFCLKPKIGLSCDVEYIMSAINNVFPHLTHFF